MLPKILRITSSEWPRLIRSGRLDISSSPVGVCSMPALHHLFGIEGIAQAISNKIKGKNRDRDEETWKPNHPGRIQKTHQSFLKHTAPTGIGGLNPKPQKTEGRLDENSLGHPQRGRNNDGIDGVGMALGS